jgi:hypothetical protein
MDKREVELVLEKSLEFWRDTLKEHVSLVDIHALAFDIWRKIESEHKEPEDAKEYILMKSELDTLEAAGDIILEDKDGTEVYLRIVDDTDSAVMLESGTILIWCGNWENQEDE